MTTPVENLEGLKRKLTISIADERINNKLEPRLRELSQKVQLKGFRPGKVPFKEIERRFGKQVRMEIIEGLVGELFGEAVDQHKLKLAGAPHIEPISLDEGQPVSFAATFEVQPEVTVQPLSGAKISKFDVTISDKDLDSIIDKMRKQHAEWNDVDRAAQDGDQLVIDFDGTLDGKPLEGGKAEGYDIELGSGSMIDGFESGLLGAKPGAELELDLTFPKDYHAKDVAGKPVHFKVKVNKVREAKLPELDEHFASKLKIKGGIEKLRDEVRENMQNEANQRAKQELKQAICDVLLEKHNIDLPQSMVDYEVQQMRKNMAARMGISIEQLNDFQAPVDYDKQARNNVTLGLIFSAFIEQEKLTVSDEQLDAKLNELAAPFSSPEQIIQMYKSQPKMLDDVKAQALEDQVIERFAEQVELSTNAVDFAEFEKQLQKKD